MVLIVILGTGTLWILISQLPAARYQIRAPNVESEEAPPPEVFSSRDIRGISANYNFTFSMPEGWRVEYVREVDAVNFYDLGAPGENNLEKSQIFMRNFRASDFQTLQTVHIRLKSPREINERPAIVYVIEKKEEVPPFPSQPLWRNGVHTVTDIRASDDSTSIFYAVAKNPDLAGSVYNEFVNSLEFPK